MINQNPSLKNQNQNKPHPVSRIISILIQMEKQINFRSISHAFGKVETIKKRKIHKFYAVQKIKSRKVQYAFSKILSFHFKSSIKLQVLSLSKKLSISVLTQFIRRIQRKNSQCFLKKLQIFKSSICIAQGFLNYIIEPVKRSRQRFLNLFIEKLKQNNEDHKKFSKCIKNLNYLIRKKKSYLLQESFSQLLKYSFCSIHFKSIKLMQNKKIQQKKLQMERNQQLRNLRLQILTLKKAFQFGQIYKNKIKKQDYQKTLMIQAKALQNKKINDELQACNRQNDMFKFEVSKLQKYLETRKKYKKQNQDYERTFKTIYQALSISRETINLHQLNLLLQRKNIDLNGSLKIFCLSKQNLLTQNIDLKNIIILYEKQISGFNSVVTITASSTYKKTFEENQNQREVLENLFIKHLCCTQEIIINKNKLNNILEGQNNSDKGSKITLITSPSSLGGITD